MKEFETLEWKNNELILIDQRLLPAVEKYVVCKTVDEVADAIKNMVVRGVKYYFYPKLIHLNRQNY